MPHRAKPVVGPQDAIFRLIVENATDLIICGDAERNRTYVSPSSRAMLGYEPSELLGGHAYSLVHPADLERVSTAFGSIGPECPCIDLSFRMRRKDGSHVWIEGRYRHIPPHDGLVAILRDVSAQKLAEEQLAQANQQLAAANEVLRTLAHTDGLTGLANRRRFDELIAEEWHRAHRQQLPLGVILIDVDWFKNYNDQYGHLAGDDCLRCIGAAIVSGVRGPGDHVARFGGEEMAVLLPVADRTGTLRVAERIVAAVLAQAIPHLGSPYGRVTASAGACAMLPMDERHAVTNLIRHADRALYKAKSGGRNRARASGVRSGVFTGASVQLVSRSVA